MEIKALTPKITNFVFSHFSPTYFVLNKVSRIVTVLNIFFSESEFQKTRYLDAETIINHTEESIIHKLVYDLII